MMKKQIFALLCGAMLTLTGCGTSETPVSEAPTETQAPQAAETRSIYLELDEHNRIDGEVTVPANMEASVYSLTMPDLSPEALFSAFLPENSQGITRISSSGTVTYKKDSGQEIRTDSYGLCLSYTADPETAYTAI